MTALCLPISPPLSASSPPAFPLISRPAIVYPQPPQPQRLNPFTSMDKKLRARFANDSASSRQPTDLPVFSQPMKFLLRPDDPFLDDIQPLSASQLAFGGLESETDRMNMELDDLPSDAFVDDYFPTPTVIDLGSSCIPLHLRSDTALGNEEEAGYSSVTISSDGSREVATSYDSSVSNKRVTFHVSEPDSVEASSIIIPTSSSNTESTARGQAQSSTASTKCERYCLLCNRGRTTQSNLSNSA